MEEEDKLYNDYFWRWITEKKRAGLLQYTNWKAIERLDHFLVIFYNSTLVVSALSSLNDYKCYEEIVNLATYLMALSHNTYHELKDMTMEMYKKFDKYWDGLKNINKMLIVATVFDPTKKMVLASLCFDELYGKDSLEGKAMYDSVIGILRSLFKEYGKRYEKSAAEKPDEAKTSNNRLSTFSLRTENRDKLDIYLKEALENSDLIAGVEYDVLLFWKPNYIKLPILSQIAKGYPFNAGFFCCIRECFQYGWKDHKPMSKLPYSLNG